MLVEIYTEAVRELNEAFRKVTAAPRGGRLYTLIPKAEAYIQAVDYSHLAGNKNKVVPVLSVVLDLKDVGKGPRREEGIVRVVEGAVAVLSGNRLGLEIKPLKVLSVREITSEADRLARHTVYLIRLSTWYVEEPRADEDAAKKAQKFLTMGLEYYLQDPTDDAVADASDEVSLQQ